MASRATPRCVSGSRFHGSDAIPRRSADIEVPVGGWAPDATRRSDDTGDGIGDPATLGAIVWSHRLELANGTEQMSPALFTCYKDWELGEHPPDRRRDVRDPGLRWQRSLGHPLRQEAAVAPASSAIQVPGVLLMAARDWLGPVGAVLTFGLGAITYYWLFYRSRLVPRWLAGWGLVGATLVTVSGVLVMFRVAAPLGTTQTVLALPIAVQEMVLAVWLIAKGFNPSAIAAESAGEPLRWQDAAPRAASAT